jgi:hypothetical protein
MKTLLLRRKPLLVWMQSLVMALLMMMLFCRLNGFHQGPSKITLFLR